MLRYRFAAQVSLSLRHPNLRFKLTELDINFRPSSIEDLSDLISIYSKQVAVNVSGAR